jgi:hypothetical protein
LCLPILRGSIFSSVPAPYSACQSEYSQSASLLA